MRDKIHLFMAVSFFVAAIVAFFTRNAEASRSCAIMATIWAATMPNGSN
jgi:site-specific recombinase